MILCGGRGTRLQEHVPSIPKPLVEIGGRPILWHVIRIYASQGWRRFVLCTGYRGEQIERFVAREKWPPDVVVECVDTGADTPTGGRIALVRDRVGEAPFCVTYADGVADIDLSALVGFHAAHDATATITVVRPRLQFGLVELNGAGSVQGFREKPQSEHWINGGFFRFEPEIFDVLSEDSVLEREPFAQLAESDRMRAFRHEGFWDCMDTYKDAVTLNDLWDRGQAPWKLW